MAEPPDSARLRCGTGPPVGLPEVFADQSLAGLLARFRAFWHAGTHTAARGSIRFQRYRVAPRLGTDLVRRRLLSKLHQHAPFPATETGRA